MKKAYCSRYLIALALFLMAPLLAGCVIADGGIFIGGPTVNGEFRKVDAVPENVIVEVNNGSGDTVVYGTSDRQVSVEGKIHVRASDKARAEQIIAEIGKNPPVRFEGPRVVISQLDKYQFDRAEVSLDLTISMPRGGSLNAKVGSGDLEVRDLNGNVGLNTGSGDAKVTNVSGSLRARTGSGDIAVRDVRGEAELTAGSGDIAAENIGSRVQAATGSGNIRIGYAGGGIDAHSGSGSINVREGKSAIRLRTASGDIRVESILMQGSSWEIESSSGDIDLLLPAASQFNLDANSHDGETVSDFHVTTADNTGTKGVLRGSIGQSSDWIRVNSRNGRIRLRKS
jgi:DUF4097 and DUF4098 domain-containing protein YvlB